MRNPGSRTAGRVFDAILSIAAIALLHASPVSAAISEPVSTETGLVSGTSARDPSIAVFKGVPFAAPPVGDLRWHAPEPAIRWQGVRKADQFGSICPQRSFGPTAKVAVAASEDCLFLNVWTGATSAAERRPVFVWIYGGRFMGGSGSEPTYDGEGLARKGLVVVTLNYRVGALGFLATPELSKESGHNASGNYGLLDQITALHWVRKNIAAFGGDPQSVTIAGQSAGAGSVIMLSNSPLAKGVFQRAIAQSGARVPSDPAIPNLATSWRSLQDAEQQGVQFAEAHGAHSIKELRALSWQQVLEGSNLNDTAAGNGYGGSPPPPLFRPVVDGWVVPFNYSQTWSKGLQNDVVFMTGNNLDESGASPQPRITLQEYRLMAKRQYGALADEYLKLYPATSDQAAGAASNAAARDSSRVSTHLFARDWQQFAKQPVYTYFWTHAPPGPDRDKRGAYHGSEINYAFDNLYATDRPWTDQDRRIADLMSSYWANIATKADPNGKGLPTWQPFSPASRTVMELGDRFATTPLTDARKFDFWKRFFATQVQW
jgi:carboxylesterase type B